MPNILVDFKSFIKLLSPEEQLYKIHIIINEFNKSNCPGDNIKKKLRIKITKNIKRANNN